MFAGNRLVLAVPADGAKVASLDDLGDDGVTIAIGSEDVPVGSYTRTVLDKLPAAQSKAILANVRSEEPDVAGITGKLTQGAVDAGFLYISDVRATDGKLKAIELPDDAAAGGRLRRRRGQGRQAPRGGEDSSSPGCWTGAGAQALTDAGFEPPPGREAARAGSGRCWSRR